MSGRDVEASSPEPVEQAFAKAHGATLGYATLGDASTERTPVCHPAFLGLEGERDPS